MLDIQSLFESGTLGYHTCRIPALVTTGSGTILAFCEGRRGGSSDDVPIDILVRRSDDGGQQWSSPVAIISDGERTCGNPCPVVDWTSGDVLLLFCKDNQEIFLSRSGDHGHTWGPPRNISAQARHPDGSFVGTGPGHGIQLASGRLLIPCWVDESPGPATWRPANWGKVQSSYALLSDDGGETWHQSEKLTHDVTDECEAAEINGTVYMTARSRGGRRQRGRSFSSDGGQSWSPVEFIPSLPEYSCQGSVLSLGGRRVLLAHPASTEDRSQMTLYLSEDGGQSWPTSKRIYEGGAAYSDLAMTPSGEIVCLFEADGYKRLVCTQFSIEWLTAITTGAA
ncbi:MAG: exo-alpha-sialidase [Gemmatimonadetes bacterium]|nr:exo-alpha-sialidase [Gemmatimonadota bacterium]MBT4612939.1 exo-alpha-sialidase [Gemmatimonadota bacterium]MBT5059263.1 exo-alpha-sialidase [Gemmatimonadota bacterium]MBT5145513.1 exo-alpha-sialidase [Gemmatimonadota bacterium]MBT5591701.1 exo-alpha-sialidase [Gemmatimonadota bacterium]